MVAFTRNDLWALGCTLYQMLSGSSPFKDASEWLIFQRIITRDLKFAEFFSHEARDLIDKLLFTFSVLRHFPVLIQVLLQDTDPSKRPGAGPDGYASVKKHPFFNGVDWKNLRKAPAPRLALDHDVHALTYSAYLLNGADYDSQDATWNLTHVGGAPSAHQHVIPDGNAGATSSSETQSHISRLASIDSFDSRWYLQSSLCFSESFSKSCSLVDNICIYVTVRQEFLEPGEAIVMISKLKKLQNLTNRKVQLILTGKPKLLCMDPSKMTAKANIIWSHSPSELSVQVANSSHFKICTHKKVISFEDAKQRAWQWKKAIEGLQHH
ncbi:3-phosphoinositide-dependent protein [Musa troglodytarum]|uniref:3-phosphoinositide-dependent protein n=1 Tax=Musa troglodytarum TaxID=320322 RepID=A0A9E7JEV6_9LILI|nr:3-phosphoinositide-dependent protein [Musa troglodytarum]